jgi:tetratricopeptide (TPR) repeat protein
MLAGSTQPTFGSPSFGGSGRPQTSHMPGQLGSSSRIGPGRPSTSGGAVARAQTPGGQLPSFAARGPSDNAEPRVGTAARAFRPARSAASSSRIHGSWSSGSTRSGAWAVTGDRFVAPQSSIASNPSGPRISEPVRLDPPAQWGAPPHRPVAAAGRPKTPGAAASSGGARATNKLQDFHMLAHACRRAGKLKEEAVAQYCSGVLLDNAGQRAKARDCYARMLAAAQACPDDGAARAARMVAHNRLGVNLQALGDHERAVMHHQAHLELADAPGRFVAHLNLGLAQAALGELEEAGSNYRHALRSAIRAGSMQGEAVACGNLALVGKQSGDLETARACLDRYLQLAEALSDSVGAVEAHHRLGDLAAELGDLQGAGSHFESALSITSAQPEQQAALNATKIEIGLAQGQLQFSEWMLTGFGGPGGPGPTS